MCLFWKFTTPVDAANDESYKYKRLQGFWKNSVQEDIIFEVRGSQIIYNDEIVDTIRIINADSFEIENSGWTQPIEATDNVWHLNEQRITWTRSDSRFEKFQGYWKDDTKLHSIFEVTGNTISQNGRNDGTIVDHGENFEIRYLDNHIFGYFQNQHATDNIWLNDVIDQKIEWKRLGTITETINENYDNDIVKIEMNDEKDDNKNFTKMNEEEDNDIIYVMVFCGGPSISVYSRMDLESTENEKLNFGEIIPVRKTQDHDYLISNTGYIFYHQIKVMTDMGNINDIVPQENEMINLNQSLVPFRNKEEAREKLFFTLYIRFERSKLHKDSILKIFEFLPLVMDPVKHSDLIIQWIIRQLQFFGIHNPRGVHRIIISFLTEKELKDVEKFFEY